MRRQRLRGHHVPVPLLKLHNCNYWSLGLRKMTNKVLLIFCDGTGQDGVLASALNEADSDAPGGNGGARYATNVLKLSRAVLPESEDGRRQIVFYQSGVGSEANFKGSTLSMAYVLQISGTAVASKIRDCYAFIAQNFQEGDDICIFGFSRGAYTARKVAGLIDKIGLLRREHLGSFFSIWKKLIDEPEKIPTVPIGTRQDIWIRCVGVWDTVCGGAAGIDALSIKDKDLPMSILCALHAVSMQENRADFAPTLWNVPKPEELLVAVDGKPQIRVFKQIFFASAHSDVGGGYAEHDLSDLALFWMAGEIQTFVNLDLAFIRAMGQAKPIPKPIPKPWGKAQPHNAASSWKIKTGLTGHGPQDRLAIGILTQDSIFHESVASSPTKLDKPANMITLESLKKKFGLNWVPKYEQLNRFEQMCKDEWPSRSTGDNADHGPRRHWTLLENIKGGPLGMQEVAFEESEMDYVALKESEMSDVLLAESERAMAVCGGAGMDEVSFEEPVILFDDPEILFERS